MNKKIKYLLVSVGMMIAAIAFSMYIGTGKTEKVVVVEQVRSSSNQVLIDKLNEDILNLKGEVKTLKTNNTQWIASQSKQDDNIETLIKMANGEDREISLAIFVVSVIVSAALSSFIVCVLHASKKGIIFVTSSIALSIIVVFCLTSPISEKITPDDYSENIKFLILVHNKIENPTIKIDYSPKLESQLLKNEQFKEGISNRILESRKFYFLLRPITQIAIISLFLSMPMWIVGKKKYKN